MKKNIFKISVLIVMLFAVAFPALAETTTSTPPADTKLSQGLACMQTAVVKRDNSILTAWNTASASVASAYSARRDALNAAWNITAKKERNAALKKAWKDFTSSVKTAKTTFKQSRDAAWKQFGTDKSACKAQYGTANTSALDYGTKGSEMSF